MFVENLFSFAFGQQAAGFADFRAFAIAGFDVNGNGAFGKFLS